MLMSSSPGILDGDQYDLKIELDEFCAVQLHTQSYQRLFNMKTGATQTMELHLKKGSTLYYLPLPAVPHENSIFTARNKIYLSENCRLIWGEVLTCGRKLNGEVFKFSKYQTITEIYLQQKMIIKENLLMQPLTIDVNAMGQLEGFTHQASLMVIDENLQITDAEKQLIDWLSLQEGIMYGLSETQTNGLVIRLLGNKAEQLHECLKTMTEILSLSRNLTALSGPILQQGAGPHEAARHA